jgi:hypothetical protein
METITFAISFLTRKCKGDQKKADIYARITVNGEQNFSERADSDFFLG